MSSTAPTTQEAKVRNTQVPWLALVVRADPEFMRKRRREDEYEFSNGRVFVGDPTKRGPYAR